MGSDYKTAQNAKVPQMSGFQPVRRLRNTGRIGFRLIGQRAFRYNGKRLAEMNSGRTRRGKGRKAMEEQLKQIAMKAGRFFLRRRLTSVVSKEGHANYVTNIDCRVQEYLRESLPGLIPGSRFIAEEQENQALGDDPTWIVDPLDGTTNMIHDYRMSAVSIALCERKKPVAGLIWQPYTREMFYAEAGSGAFLNGRPIHVSDTPFRDALVAVGTAPYYEELEETGMAMALDYLKNCADIRRSGSAALDLAYLACGRHEIFFEMRLKPWDYAAGSLILQEAGGEIRMPLAGPDMDYDLTTAILAATPACMAQAAEVFARHTSGGE